MSYPRGILGVLWEVLIKNTGQTHVSITGWDAKASESYQPIQEKNVLSNVIYDHFKQGLFKPYPDLEPAQLPINIGPGQSVRLYVKTGVLLHHEAFYKVSEQYQTYGDVTSLCAVLRHLHENRIDIYGNKMFVGPRSHYATPYPNQDPLEQLITIQFSTSTGITKETNVSWYKLNGNQGHELVWFMSDGPCSLDSAGGKSKQ